jgi:ABC-type antimicrobial peptide transport system permease subunit
MENLLVRTEGEPMALARAVRHAAYLEAPFVPLDHPQTLDERTSYLTDGAKRAMWLLGVFAGLALLLAGVGICGVSSYSATQRSREMGIRMALGAQFVDIAGLSYRGVLLPSAIGLTVGAGAAFWLTRLLNSLVFGVSTGDVSTLAAAGIALLGVSALAAAGPALRAALSDPVKVLRRD